MMKEIGSHPENATDEVPDSGGATSPSGPVLALESSTAVGSVAVGDGDEIRAEIVLNVGPGHSSALLPAVEEAMRIAGLAPADLAAIVIGGGPGSFTGLRIAAATAKGMLSALQVPLYAYSGLLAAAAAHLAARGPVWGLFDARRRDLFAACYRFTDRVEVLATPAALSLDEVIQQAQEGGDPPFFVGDGALLHADEITRETGGRVAPPHLSAPRASALIWLAHHEPAVGYVPDPARWEPDYVRAAGVERIAAARAASESS